MGEHELDDNDKLDLGLWLSHGGFEQFLKDNRIDWESEDARKEAEQKALDEAWKIVEREWQ